MTKFKKLNHILEYEVNNKLSLYKKNYKWYKNEDGIIFEVLDNLEIEKLNSAQDEYNKRIIK